MVDLSQLKQSIIDGDAASSKSLTEQAISEGNNPHDLLQNQLIPAMDEVGCLFEEEEYFIPEMLLSARAMKESLGLLRPHLLQEDSKPVGTAVIGTVKGDLHDIGKNLVATMLEGGGFDVIDLGVDVPPEKFIDAVKEHNATIVCLSTLLTTTMPSIKTTLEAFTQNGIRDQVKIMIGGAPITQHFAEEIGADGYGDNARSAVLRAKELVQA